MDKRRQRARTLRNEATDTERHLWRFLRLRQLDGLRFRRQVPLAGYVADFVCPQLKLVVELDGGQHAEQTAYDARRTQVLVAHGYRVLRYWNDDVLLHTTEVLEDILRHAKSTPPQPSPPPSAQGREQEPSRDPDLPPFSVAKERVGEGCS